MAAGEPKCHLLENGEFIIVTLHVGMPDMGTDAYR